MNTYDIIVLLNDENATVDDVLKTVEDATKQTIRPRNIRLVLNVDGIQPKNLVPLMPDIIPDEIPWCVEFVQPSLDGRLSSEASLDFAADKCDSTYYSVFNAGATIPNDFLAKASEAGKFVMLEPDENGNGLTVHKKLHKELSGNRCVILERLNDDEVIVGDNIVEKTKHIAKFHNQEHLIKKAQDICPLSNVSA